MKSVRVIESYSAVTKEIGKRFYPVQKYFWLFGFVLSTFFIIWYHNSHHDFLPFPNDYTTWVVVFGIMDFAVFSAFFTVGASGFAIGVIFGVFVIPKIRDTNWRSVIIYKLLKRRKTVYTNLNDDQFAHLVGNEIEKIMKKYGIIPDIPVKTGVSIANEAFQNLSEEFKKYKEKNEKEKDAFRKEIQSLSRLLKSHQKEQKKWQFWK